MAAYQTIKQSDEHEKIVFPFLRDFSQRRQQRTTWEAHWEEIAEVIDPSSRNTFTYQHYNTPGEKKTDRQVDASGMLALSRFGAILDSLLTPANMIWHGLNSDDPVIRKDRKCQEWYQHAREQLFTYRYKPLSNYTGQNQATYKSLGAYGTGSMFIDKFEGPIFTPGLRYKSLAIGSTFFRQNHQGLYDGFIRVLKLTAYQALQKWGAIPETMATSLDNGSEELFTFLHRVQPREDYEPYRLDAKGKPYSSCYISEKGRCVMQEGGYNSFPVAATKYEESAEELYGRGPAIMVLPSLKTLNAEKTTFLKQGHRAADPVLLLADDGLMNMNLRPGALNPGGWSTDGKPLVGVLPSGQIQISKEMMQDEKAIINDAFLVTLFQILTETPQMTATEVIERTNEKGILLAPTVGAQQGKYLGPKINRELDLLSQQGLLRPMPQMLREARGEYSVVYTSPISRAAKAQQSAGFMRTVESVKELVNITGDPGLLDPFNFDVAIPEIAENQAVPVTWMATAEEVAAKRQSRAQAMAKQDEIKALPNQAAMIKAQAVAAEKAPQQQPGANPGIPQ